jgi:hypothetical protein
MEDSMDHDAIGLLLEENGLRILARSMLPTDVPLEGGRDNAQSWSPSTLADLDLVDPEDDDDDHNDGADDDWPGLMVSQRHRPGRGEDTELVAAAFQAAGNRKFEDVRLRSAKTSDHHGPTHRETAVEQAKRLNRSVSW